MTTPLGTWLWFKWGDHRPEGDELCARFVSESGAAASLDDVSVRVAHTPAGKALTVIQATDPWWHERFSVHPNGWRGHPIEAVAERLGL